MRSSEEIAYIRNSQKSAELMEFSASNYYPPNEEGYADYSAVTPLPMADEYKFEDIIPSDIKMINLTTTKNENLMEKEPNITQKVSKLLFSSPSATVTSHGPSGPFKAIICHDCDNSEGRNVGHSVSFSAIKNWNVESPKLEQAESNHTLMQSIFSDSNTAKASDNYLENQQNTHEENQQIKMNDKIEIYKAQNVASETKKPTVPDVWNYSLLSINNESSGLSTTINNSHSIVQKKPIFNDLLKVPYDVLNAPLAEPSPSEPVKSTQIHINHQQRFNDTITSNYQHFQQFIQKNLNSNMMQQLESTPMPEENYEVDESVSLMTNGRAHGVQSTTTRVNSRVDETKTNIPSKSPLDQDAKFGYVVEGRNFRKYRVEEKTADGFIVG